MESRKFRVALLEQINQTADEEGGPLERASGNKAMYSQSKIVILPKAGTEVWSLSYLQRTDMKTTGKGFPS